MTKEIIADIKARIATAMLSAVVLAASATYGVLGVERILQFFA